MERAEVAGHLNTCLAGVARGFLAYVRESLGEDLFAPLIGSPEPALKEILQNASAEDHALALDLVDTIEALGDNADLSTGGFPFRDFHFNFLRPEYLAGVVERHLTDDLVRLREAAGPITGDPDVGPLVDRLLSTKQGQVERVAAWRASREEAAGESV